MEIIYIIRIIAGIYYPYSLYTIVQGFFFIAEQLHYAQKASKEMYNNLFNQSPIIRHFDCFPFLLW